MKKTIITLLCIAINFTTFAENTSPVPLNKRTIQMTPIFGTAGSMRKSSSEETDSTENTLTNKLVKSKIIFRIPPPIDIPEDSPVREMFSPEAVELIKEYTPRNTGVHGNAFYNPPLDLTKHVNEVYRSAWEELYLGSVVNDAQNNNVRFVPDDITTSAIGGIAGTNSIPFLHDLYVAVLNEKTDKTQQRQNEMLKMLLCIDASEALDTVFSLLDLTESKTGTEAAATLREGLVKDLARTLEKSETLNAYKNPNLSEKNKAFLETARKVGKEAVVR